MRPTPASRPAPRGAEPRRARSSGAPPPRPGDRIDGRYVALASIGEGSSGVVLRARDRWSDREVALKVLRDEDEAGRELSIAVDAGHPGLVRALGFGRVAAGPYLVMELCEGRAPAEAVAADDRMGLAVLADQVLAALAFLHARGLVHGDVKPENMRVAEVDGRLRVRLLDLGLARPVGSIGGGGTAAYASPEVLAGGAVDARSDLFSLGVVLYEIAAGALPFGDPEDGRFVARVLAGDASPLARSPMADVIMRLLSRDAEARYATAGEARAAVSDATPGLTCEDGAGLEGVTPALVGRDAALAVLAGAAAEPVASRARIVGPRGAGKSRLLARAALDATRLGFTAIVVSAAGEGQDCVIDLLDRASLLPGGQGCAAARDAVARAARGEEGAAPGLLAAAHALGEVAAAGRTWIGVDDLDRADAASREALAFLARGQAPIAWVATCRDAEGAALGELTRDVALDALAEPQIRALVGSMLPGLVEIDALTAAAHARSSGLPGTVVRGLRALEACRALRLVGGRYRFLDAEAADAAFVDEGEGRAAEEAVAALEEGSRELLAALALTSAACTAEAIVELCGATTARAAEALRAGARAGLIAMTRSAGGEGARFAGPEAAAALVATIVGGQTVRVWTRALACLDDPTGPRLGVADGAALFAARHRAAAALGMKGRAATEALAAADRCASSASHRAAADWYARARALAKPAAKALLAEAEALAAAGALDAAIEAFARAEQGGAALEGTALATGRALARGARYAAALDALGPAGEGAEARFWRAWSLLHTGRYDAAAELATPRAEDLPADAARLLRARGTIHWQRGELGEARQVLAEATGLAAQAGDRALAAEIDMSAATALRLSGDLDGAAARYERAILYFQSIGSVAMLARCTNNRAITAYQAGRWEQARIGWDAFADLAARLDDTGERVLAGNNLGMLWKDRGELGRAEAAFDRAAALAAAAGLRRYEAMAAGNLAETRVLAGDLDGAGVALDRATAIARSIDADGELCECTRRAASLALARGDAHEALARARESAAQATALGADLDRGSALLVGVAAARALPDLGLARALLDEAKGAIAAGGTRFERARVSLEEAKLFAAAGEAAPSHKAAREALAVFVEVGAAREIEEARGLERGDQGAGGDLALDLASVLSSTSDATAMLERLLDRVLAATGAERGLVVLLEGDLGPRVAAMRLQHGVDAPPPRLSAGIAERVIASRRPLLIADLGEHEDIATRASVVAIGLRAALAAPLMRGDDCLGLLYIDTRSSPRDLARFGQRPLEVAAAMLAPALDLLLSREREHDRAEVLRTTSEELLESICAIDAAIDLVAEEEDPARRSSLSRTARSRCGALLERAEAVLGLLRHADDGGAATDVDLGAVIRYALDGRDGATPALDLGAPSPRVRAGAAGLARVLLQAIEAASGGGTREVCIRARVIEDDGVGAVLGWRPGETEKRRRVRIAITGVPAGEATAPPIDDWIAERAVVLRTARRALRAWGGGLTVAGEGSGVRIEIDLAEGGPREERAS